MAINKNQILFPGIVEDDKDPMCLGRIRIRPQTELQDFPTELLNLYGKIDNGKFKFTKWGSDDPYVFLPLLPIHFYNVPKEKEFAFIVYQDKDFRRENQFYIPGPISSPMNIRFENFAGAITFLGQGAYNQVFKPLKNLLNQYNEVKSIGIFPEPGDVAILGRGSTDLVLKENEVLLRAGKTQPNNLSPTTFPKGNQYRAFVQLSNFTQTIVPSEPKTVETPQESVSYVKKMIVWEITDLANQVNALTGNVSIYSIKGSSKVTTTKFKSDTILDLKSGDDFSAPLMIFQFIAKTQEEVGQLITSIANSLFDGEFNVPGYENSVTSNTLFRKENEDERIPFVITPSQDTYINGIRNQTNVDDINDSFELNNFLKISSSINVKQKNAISGFLLVSGRSGDGKNPVIGPSTKFKKEVITDNKYFASPITYGAMGARKLYFLSHDSEGPNGKIDLRDTLYGIPQPRFTEGLDSIEKLTYPMVRGDKIIELLEKIIQYLTTHVHPFFGMPPVPSPVLEDVLKTIADAPNTILNQNIRIN